MRIPHLAKLTAVQATVWADAAASPLPEEAKEALIEEFNKPEPESSRPKTPLATRSTAHIVEAKRLNNVNILLKKTKIDVEGLRRYILEGAEGEVPSELFVLIYSLVHNQRDRTNLDKEREVC